MKNTQIYLNDEILCSTREKNTAFARIEQSGLIFGSIKNNRLIGNNGLLGNNTRIRHDHFQAVETPTKAKFIFRLFDKLNGLSNEDFVVNEKAQIAIESLIFDEFDVLFSDNKKQYIVAGINTNLLNAKLNHYIIEKKPLISLFVDKLIEFYKGNEPKRSEQKFIKDILTTVDREFLINLTLLHFILVFVYQESDNDKNYNLLGVSVTMGKKIFTKYLNILKFRNLKENSTTMTYSAWKEKWGSVYPDYDKFLNDSIFSELGCKLIDILDIVTWWKRN